MTISGTFTLKNPDNGKETRNITFDASENFMKTAITEDLGLQVFMVRSGNIGQIKSNTKYDVPELGRYWRIYFDAIPSDYGDVLDAPRLLHNDDNLGGVNAYVWTALGTEAKQSLRGNFTLAFRGSQPTQSLRFDSSKEDMEAALESLDSIVDCSVERSVITDAIGDKYGFSWTVTFHQVNHQTAYGWLLDKDGRSVDGNMPALALDGAALYGWGVGGSVDHVFGSGGGEDMFSWWQPQKRGSGGAAAGEVVVSRRNGEQWQNEAVLVGEDVNANDQFGFSVSLLGKFLLVGAPSKEVGGDKEQQLLNCTATAGSFTLSFRGFTSSAIQYNADVVEIRSAILGNFPHSDNIHPITALTVTPLGGWNGLRTGGGNGFCNSGFPKAAVQLTFDAPAGGNSVNNITGNLEMLTLNTGSLNPTNGLTIKELRRGTGQPNGDYNGNILPGFGSSHESGAAYLYEEKSICSGLICTYQWDPVVKFDPLDTDDEPQHSQQFGYSVSSGSFQGYEYMMVGSPGSDYESGKVFFFRKINGLWSWKQTLTSAVWGREKFARFGHALESDDGTLVVSSPGYKNETGAVYIWNGMVNYPDVSFVGSQAIFGPSTGSNAIQKGDRFGCSVDISGHELVICACKQDAFAVHTGTSRGATKKVEAGACYLYKRNSYVEVSERITEAWRNFVEDVADT